MAFIAPRGVRRKLFQGTFYSEAHSLTYIGADPARDVSLFPRQLLAPMLDSTASHIIMMIAAPIICNLISAI
jgi:hypothetical protein